jgi:hypothetical protein
MQQIVPGSLLTVGQDAPVRAIVCTIRPKRVEVVYLDAAGRALHQEIEWRKGAWELISGAQNGHPADRDTRLEPYVKMLRVQ